MNINRPVKRVGEKDMISNIKLQQIIAQNGTRQHKSVSTIARTNKDQQTSDQYLASELASVLKAKLQEMHDQGQLEKVLQLKQLNQNGQYEVDVDKLAQTLLDQYR